jgi:hypothetical protein
MRASLDGVFRSLAKLARRAFGIASASAVFMSAWGASPASLTLRDPSLKKGSVKAALRIGRELAPFAVRTH